MSSLQTEQPIDTRFSIKPTTEEYLEKFILNMMLDYENGSTRDSNINVGKFLAIKNKICDEFNIRYLSSTQSEQQQIEALLQKYKCGNI